MAWEKWELHGPSCFLFFSKIWKTKTSLTMKKLYYWKIYKLIINTLNFLSWSSVFSELFLKSLSHQFRSPQFLTLKKVKSDCISSALFWIGVPVTHHRENAGRAQIARAVLVVLSLIVWASSNTTRNQGILKIGESSKLECILNSWRKIKRYFFKILIYRCRFKIMFLERILNFMHQCSISGQDDIFVC